MGILEIFLIVVGVVLIVVSFIVSDKMHEKNDSSSVSFLASSANRIIEEEILNFKDKMKTLFEEESETALIKADNTLNRNSNEKLIEMNEFAEQVLEKINKNHSDVVFLYNMLNEKEEEIKKLVQQIDKSKSSIENVIYSHQEGISRQQGEKKRGKSDGVDSNELEGERQQNRLISKSRQGNEQARKRKPVQEIGKNNNEKILKLYNEGKSVIEISRILGLGQGEIKLVINLFQGEK